MKTKHLASLSALAFALAAPAPAFDGLFVGLENIHRLSDAQTRSVSPENFTGEKGGGAKADPVADAGKPNAANSAAVARPFGAGWKVNPKVVINSGQTFTLADIAGPGAIQHMWMTPTENWRLSILRIYWDDETEPSVECPIGDFFAMGWGVFAPVSSLAVCVNPGSAFNCYWPMPFRKRCKMTVENLNPRDMSLYYQIDYALAPVPDDAAYFHAQFRRKAVNETSDYTIIDGVRGRGHYVGVYLAWGVRNNGWWGEGEIKFFLDGDGRHPTICGTGTEDYFCGSYNFENRQTKQYQEYCTPYAGLCQVIRPDGVYISQQRFGLYRWHLADPVRFQKDLRVTMQDLGWRGKGGPGGDRTYLKQKSDIASTCFWYQAEPHAPFPKLPEKWELETN
ncbi:MAG: DUF2961 domain-containing protein [Opitutaceae bacterium]|jgi:hypothetical protein|nr:DUF2961 domain-containing protein [Opitutaceae bacterium]